MNRKHLMLVTLIFFFGFTIKLQARESKFGIKGGANFSVLNADDADKNMWILGFNGGVTGEFMVNENLGFQSEIVYTTKGGKTTYNENFLGLNIADGETKLMLSYIEVPIHLSLYLGDAFRVYAGPYVGFLMKSKVETDTEVLGFMNVNDEEEIDNDYFNNMDYGLSGGVEFLLDPVFLGAKYSVGLQQVANPDEATNEIIGNAKNNTFQIYLGIYLN